MAKFKDVPEDQKKELELEETAFTLRLPDDDIEESLFEEKLFEEFREGMRQIRLESAEPDDDFPPDFYSDDLGFDEFLIDEKSLPAMPIL
jgi:hypothetical protein